MKKFSDLRAKMSPEARARVEARVKKMLRAMSWRTFWLDYSAFVVMAFTLLSPLLQFVLGTNPWTVAATCFSSLAIMIMVAFLNLRMEIRILREEILSRPPAHVQLVMRELDDDEDEEDLPNFIDPNARKH